MVPPIPKYGQTSQNTMRLFRRAITVNDINYQPQYIRHYENKFRAQNSYRSKMLEQITQKQAPDLSKEPDLALTDMLDFKFVL